jgi:hypothetical protein
MNRVEVDLYEHSIDKEQGTSVKTLRWAASTGTSMQTPLEEAADLIDRIKAGELDHLLVREIEKP